MFRLKNLHQNPKLESRHGSSARTLGNLNVETSFVVHAAPRFQSPEGLLFESSPLQSLVLWYAARIKSVLERSYEPESKLLKGEYLGKNYIATSIGVMRGDSGSLDYSSTLDLKP